MTPSPEQWRLIEALYSRIVELPQEERTSFLERECKDERVRLEVERLLDQQPTSSGFLDPPVPEAIAACLASTDRMIGERLGDFVLEERIGSGGMGVVFRAHQLGLDRRVAVKVLDRSVRADPIAVERFRREAQAASRLEHPNIASVLAYGDHGDLSYYAMPLVDGWSLRDLLDGSIQGAPDLADPNVAARLMRDVADALSYSHEQGVIHRDVKPQNVLVTRRQHAPRLIDFGLAKVLSFSALSRTGDAAGTPLYMSPEQIRAETGTVDHRTDIYSAGAVLYELLAGTPPFQGENVQQILYRITHERPPSIRAVASHVPRDLETIALKALRRKPDDRYETAGELRDDLDRFLAGAAIVAKPLKWSERLAEVARRPRAWKVAAPVLLVSALSIGWMLADWVSASDQPSGLLDVTLPRGVASATADLARIDLATDELQPLESDIRLPIEGRRLTKGLYRVTVRAPGRAFSEYDRRIQEDEAVRVEPVLQAEDPSSSGMLKIPSGPYTVGVRGGTGPDAATTRQVPAFWIDRTEVSCARYREFLEAFPDLDLEVPWGDREYDPAWDDKPVTHVSFADATRFAEWEGKRLPTWTEMQAASRGPKGFLFPWGDDPQDPTELAVIARGGEPWFSYVVDVDEDLGDRSDFGVLHTYGNVREWTVSQQYGPEGSRFEPVSGFRRIHGHCWKSPLLWPGDEIKDLQSAPGLSMKSTEGAGIRCARSIIRQEEDSDG